MKIKKGDNVLVIAGKDRGKSGRVIEVLPTDFRVRVEGIALYKRHLKTTGIQEMVGTLHVSNVMVLDPASSKPTRVGYKFDGDKKVRVGRGKLNDALLDTK